jgi:hypothetical protein
MHPCIHATMHFLGIPYCQQFVEILGHWIKALHFAFFNWDVKEQFTRYRVNKKHLILLTGSPGAVP